MSSFNNLPNSDYQPRSTFPNPDPHPDVRFTNQLAYQHSFTPLGYSFDNPFIYDSTPSSTPTMQPSLPNSFTPIQSSGHAGPSHHEPRTHPRNASAPARFPPTRLPESISHSHPHQPILTHPYAQTAQGSIPPQPAASMHRDKMRQVVCPLARTNIQSAGLSCHEYRNWRSLPAATGNKAQPRSANPYVKRPISILCLVVIAV